VDLFVGCDSLRLAALSNRRFSHVQGKAMDISNLRVLRLCG
jgi:hypothetical protein